MKGFWIRFINLRTIFESIILQVLNLVLIPQTKRLYFNNPRRENQSLRLFVRS